jgi:hypothetical protein
MSTSLLSHAFIRGHRCRRTGHPDGQVIFTIHQEPKDLPLLGVRFGRDPEARHGRTSLQDLAHQPG